MVFLENVAALIMLFGFLPYLTESWTKIIKPARATWFIWLILDWSLWIGMYETDTLNPVINLTVVCVLIAFILSIRHGTGGVMNSVRDRYVVGLTLVGFTLWQALVYELFTLDQIFQPGIIPKDWNSAVIIIFFGSILQLSGFIPMAQETWINPKSESPLTWTFAMVSGLVMLGSLFYGQYILNMTDVWKFEASAQPIVYGIIQTSMFLILMRSKGYKRIKPDTIRFLLLFSRK